MIRIVLFLFLILVVLAVRYLPLWALIVLPLVLFSSLYFFRRFLFTALFSIPFRMKGKVLRGASVTVHSIRSIPQPAIRDQFVDVDDEETDDDNQPRDLSLAKVYDYYELDVTISPKTSNGRFLFWEPGELTLAASGSTNLSDDDQTCSIIDRQLFPRETKPEPRLLLESKQTSIQSKPDHENHQDSNVEQEVHDLEYDEEEEEEDEDAADAECGKFFGAQRLIMQIGVPRGVRKLIFNYYFEKFGAVSLP